MSPVISRERQPFVDGADGAILPIVDAQHHFWSAPTNPHHWLTEFPRIPFQYDEYSAISSDFLPRDYAKASREQRGMRHVVMEREWDSMDLVGATVRTCELARRYGVHHAQSVQI